MLELFKLDQQLVFPPVEFALEEPDGLLAFGGDLSVPRLVAAYKNGIFPWFGNNEPLLWWSPSKRGIIELDSFHCAKSLTKCIRKNNFTVTLNYDFDAVISHCSSIPRNFGANPQSDTWITNDMQEAYKQLHHQGYASSVEVWSHGALVAGLYGVTLGGIFCGESMFHKVTNGSKIALLALVQFMKKHKLGFIDCQMKTDHLATLGCVDVERAHFLSLLSQYCDTEQNGAIWTTQELTISL